MRKSAHQHTRCEGLWSGSWTVFVTVHQVKDGDCLVVLIITPVAL